MIHRIWLSSKNSSRSVWWEKWASPWNIIFFCIALLKVNINMFRSIKQIDSLSKIYLSSMKRKIIVLHFVMTN